MIEPLDRQTLHTPTTEARACSLTLGQRQLMGPDLRPLLNLEDGTRSRITDEMNEQFRTPGIMGQGEATASDLPFAYQEIRSIREHLNRFCGWGATPRTALNPTLRESEADIQTSEAQALKEEVRRLIQNQKDQEAPALRAYLTRFRQRDEIFPDRSTDKAKRLQDQGIDAQLGFTAPPVDILPELLEYLEIHEPDLFLLNIPRSEEDQRAFCLKLRTTASEHSSSTKDNA
eukprot:g81271.t1